MARDVERIGRRPVLTSVSAAYLQRNLSPRSAPSPCTRQLVFQKPFSTGDPELAGFDNQTTRTAS